MRPNYRRFCLITILFVAALLLYNGLVWHFFTHDLLTRDAGYFTGDLARMGYHTDCADKRKTYVDLPRQHQNIRDYQGGPVDMVVVGDSFAQIGGNGRNPFFQDYIATANDFNVVNIGYWPGNKNLMESVLILLNSGMLDQLKPRYLLLETVVRNCYRYSEPINFERSAPLAEVRKIYGLADVGDPEEKGLDDLPDVSFINSGNFKWLFNKVLYQFSPRAVFSKAYRLKLDRPLFSGSSGDTLLFISKDLNKLDKYNADNVAKVNQNLNRLAGLLQEKGIEFIFLPPPDKYDLYRPYLVDNPFPENLFFPLLRPLPKEYNFIDAKRLLTDQLENGVQDVYFIDDTHWSWKASEALFGRPMFP